MLNPPPPTLLFPERVSSFVVHLCFLPPQALKTKTAPSSSIQKPVSGSGQKNGSQRNEIFVDILERCVRRETTVRNDRCVGLRARGYRQSANVDSSSLAHKKTSPPSRVCFVGVQVKRTLQSEWAGGEQLHRRVHTNEELSQR